MYYTYYLAVSLLRFMYSFPNLIVTIKRSICVVLWGASDTPSVLLMLLRSLSYPSPYIAPHSRSHAHYPSP